MPAISASVVRAPQRRYHCTRCGSPIDGPHLSTYGHADDGHKPYRVRVCLPCTALGAPDPIIEAALARWEERPDDHHPHH